MKRLLIAVVLVGCGKSDRPVPTQADKTALVTEACPMVTGAYFFEVSKDGRTSHILGTRHIGIGLFRFPDIVGKTLDSAALLVEEIAPGNLDKPTFKSEPLRTELGPSDWAHFQELVTPPVAKRMENMQGIVAALVLIAMYEDVTMLLDKQIAERAELAKIPGAGLETSSFQMNLLTKLLDVRLVRALVEETPSREKLWQLTHDGIQRYCQGTEKEEQIVDGVEEQQMLAHGFTKADLDKIQDELLYDRNTAWIPKLDKIFEQDKVFVAVGAGHLMGPRGVIELLKQRGYVITRITK
jgi:uncharacterized protein YbaP (TraB family)